MAKNNNARIMEKLQGLSGAVIGFKNIHSYVIRSPSPSLNFTFGKAHGLPAGYTMTLFGPPKGGKSVIANAMAGQLHRDDPEAWVIKFNTEMREEGQLTEEQAGLWGIDPNRYIAYETNHPEEIFDRIEKEFLALHQDLGMKVKLVIIDSLTAIMGRRQLNAEGVMQQQIGDKALTIQEGLQRILGIQRKMGFGLIMTSHVRAQMDPVEVMRGNKVRAATSFATQHHAEYNMYVEPNRTKEGRVDIAEKSFYNEGVEDLAGKGEKFGHKIRVKMLDSSMGPKERSGEFTLDYNKGIVNVHEEIFWLGTGYNIITRKGNHYTFGDKTFNGKVAFAEGIKNNPEMGEQILNELRRRDLAGELADQPVTSTESSEE